MTVPVCCVDQFAGSAHGVVALYMPAWTACCFRLSSSVLSMIGVELPWLVGTVGATWPALKAMHWPAVVWLLPWQRIATLPGGSDGPAPALLSAVLTMTLLPLLVVVNQSALIADDGQVIGFSARDASPMTVCGRHALPHTVARTQTALSPLASQLGRGVPVHGDMTAGS